MAKGKRSVALFEVIHKDKRFDRGVTPEPAPPEKRPWFKLRPAPAPALQAAKAVKPAAPRRPSRIAAAGGNYLASMKLSLRRMRAAVSKSGEALQTQFGNFTGPLLGALAALVVCGGVLLARHYSGASRPTTAGIMSTDDLRRGPAHPEVLQVPGRAAIAAQTNFNPAPAGDGREAQQAGQIIPPSSTRQINLNYVLVQSYAEEKMAIEARDFLNENGVSCTIERGVKNWRKDFYLVIGLQGFPKASGPDYVAYRTRIEALSDPFVRKSHGSSKYKAFSPQAIKWDRAD